MSLICLTKRSTVRGWQFSTFEPTNAQNERLPYSWPMDRRHRTRSARHSSMLFAFADASRCERSHLTCSTTRTTGPRVAAFSPRWTRFVRGDIHRLRAPKATRGHEQQGARYAVLLQSDDLMLSTVLVAPTSRSSAPRIFRPTITIDGDDTQVLIEQTSAVAHERLGELVGRLRHDELEAIDEALRLVLELD